ncbi:MAG: EscR/YscR/HrcR family type III secretion system export apparatus protein [Acidobacteriota bacterium]
MSMVLLLGALSLLPFLLMMTTSFLKFAVVLSILRNAMGTQQIPPNPVIMGLAVILTVYVMAPVASEVRDLLDWENQDPPSTQGSPPAGSAAAPYASKVYASKTSPSKTSAATPTELDELWDRLQRAQPPVRDFLARHAGPAEKELFLRWAHTMGPPEWRDSVGLDHLLVLVPAFAISELTEAFAIGFLLFLPFLVVDMVVSNILLAMGMHMLSPVVVSLPFKLLLFIMIDGWSLLAQGLLAGYLPAGA